MDNADQNQPERGASDVGAETTAPKKTKAAPQAAETTMKHAGLAEALFALQAAPIEAKQSGTNPHFGKGYSTLEDCWQACRKPLQENELYIQQSIQPAIGEGFEVITNIVHAPTGENRGLRLPVANQDNMQKIGSAITYARRYGLVTLVGILTGEDDDGTAAVSPKPAATKATPMAAPPPQAAAGSDGELATKSQTDYLKGLLTKKDTSADPDHWAGIAEARDKKTITKQDARVAIDALLKLPDWNDD